MTGHAFWSTQETMRTNGDLKRTLWSISYLGIKRLVAKWTEAADTESAEANDSHEATMPSEIVIGDGINPELPDGMEVPFAA